MTLKTALVASVLAAAALAGPGLAQTPGSPAAKRDCFYGGNVNGFNAVDNSTVLLSIGTKQIYEVKLFSPSIDVKWANGIALVSRGGSFICSRLDADIVVPSTVGPAERFPVSAIRRLSPEEVAALPKKLKP